MAKKRKTLALVRLMVRRARRGRIQEGKKTLQRENKNEEIESEGTMMIFGWTGSKKGVGGRKVQRTDLDGSDIRQMEKH